MELRTIPTDQLDTGEHEQRFTYEDEEQQDLVASIRTSGILIPLIVRAHGARYLVTDGHRRLQAARGIGLTEVPCQLIPDDHATGQRAAFIANFLRKDPTPIELAVAIAKAVAAGEENEAEIARTLHRSPDWVKRQCAMLQWPEDVLQAIHHGSLSIAAASNLAQVDNDQYRAFLLEHAVNNGATARTTAAWLQEYKANQPLDKVLAAQAEPPATGPGYLTPQAPCLCCASVKRMDELSHVPLCAPCIQRVRQLKP